MLAGLIFSTSFRWFFLAVAGMKANLANNTWNCDGSLYLSFPNKTNATQNTDFTAIPTRVCKRDCKPFSREYQQAAVDHAHWHRQDDRVLVSCVSLAR
jgi:hypothetical protein